VSLIALPAGRRSKYLVAAVALLIAFGLASQGGKLDSVISNNQADGLPTGAESRAALKAVERYPAGETTPAVVVVRREGGLTGADRAYLAAQRRSLNADRIPDTLPAGTARISPDGTTAFFVVPLATADDLKVTDGTTALRERLAEGRPEGLTVQVTGAAGISADLSAVFDGADAKLLFGTALLVLVLLVLIYRSPIFWVIPLFTVLVTEAATRGVGYFLGSNGLVIDAASSGIQSVLVFGAATDYALLLVARYREELRRHEDRHEAMALALRSAGPAILASGLTVAAALLTLLLAEVGGTKALGPLSATGVTLAMLLSLTLLPSTLLMAGRRAFWPAIPRFGQPDDALRGPWGRLGKRISRRPRRVWVGGFTALAIMALGLTQLSGTLGGSAQFTTTPEAVEGQATLARGFPSGTSAAADVIVPDPERAGAVRDALAARTGLVASVGEPQIGPPGARLEVVLREDPLSGKALDQIPELRRIAKGAGGEQVLVGGQTAEQYDLRRSARRDEKVIVPAALLVVLLILMALLRAVTLPVQLIVTVVASFAAALGVGAVVFEQVFGFEGSDPTLPLLAFVFLVALGIDYNIFLASRVREEALGAGTRRGMTLGLAVTGSVITSAGVVLAGTFSILGVLPLVALAELGFVIAFGVLLDTLIVRSVIVPALVYDTGPPVWWPSRLSRSDRDRR